MFLFCRPDARAHQQKVEGNKSPKSMGGSLQEKEKQQILRSFPGGKGGVVVRVRVLVRGPV